MEAEGDERCFLCGRPLGKRIEWHHPVPKSRGGRETRPIHPICHRTVHATFDNKALERRYADPDALRAQPDIAAFLTWIADKNPDFHAPTRKRKR
ncbi:HNH endonuclease [Allosphingosinicella vermicomposti]|uniref:HNH endonuclease n=1 Tax=Allosphingosinicella vermicomposti TaxID=614671 RepID=UPI0018F87EB7|nr:HNH endonuclease [Allosphingosinicella vermicomposti]